MSDETDRLDARKGEMRSNRTRRIDRDTAEQILRGVPSVRHGFGLLAAPMIAARAPAHLDELAGEQAALAAFEAAAQLDPVSQPRRPSMLKIALAKLLTVKAAAVIAATGAGGVALAASTGALPNPMVDTPANHAPANPATTPSHPGPPNDPAAEPSPSLAGLCVAYLAEVGTNPGKALDSPAFTALITAAGRADQVDDYCQTLAANPAVTDRPGAVPSNAARPTGVPTPAEIGAPTGRPDEPGAGTPTAAPSGPPAAPPGR